MQVKRQPARLSEDCKGTAPTPDYQGDDKAVLDTMVPLECHPEDDCTDACPSDSGFDLESQLESCITTVLSESHIKTNRLIWPPLPVSPENGWNIFPPWIAVSIVVLALVGILGAIFELRFQLNW